MREIRLERNTAETQIELTLDLDGAGIYQVDTGCGFLNHMLELFARHGRFDLVLTCHGDVEVDYHHTAEDIGIALGQAFRKGLGDMRGIQRYGSFCLPMDEALLLCAVDLSGRCTLRWDVRCPTEASPRRCTLSSWPGKTATTSSKPAGKGWPGPCPPPSGSIRHTGTRSPQRKDCWYDRRH